MTTNQGIFQADPNPAPSAPFAWESFVPAAASPFVAVGNSPFALVDETEGARTVEPGKPAKLPDRRPRPAESPFQMVDDRSGGSLEATAGYATPVFEPSPPTSPFAIAPQAGPGYQVPPPFGAWPQQPQSQPPQQYQPAPQTQPVAVPQVFAPVSVPAPAPAPPPMEHLAESNSAHIRQIELRAIFGVDREMGHEEILQRVRALPGIRQVARLDARHLGALESFRQVLANLGFGTGGLRICAGSSPVA